MDDTLSLMGLLLPAAASLMCLLGALALSGIVIMNKGAKANASLTLLALGLLCFGIALGDRVVVMLDLPNLESWQDGLFVAGSAFMLVSAAYGRSLFKQALK